MSPNAARRKRGTFNPFLASMLVVVGIFGALVTLQATDQADIPVIRNLPFFEREVVAGPPANRTEVLVSRIALQPGAALKLSDVWDAQLGYFTTRPVRNEDMKDEWILDWFRRILGR